MPEELVLEICLRQLWSTSDASTLQTEDKIIINERKDVTAAEAAKSRPLLLEEDLLRVRHCSKSFTRINS